MESNDGSVRVISPREYSFLTPALTGDIENYHAVCAGLHLEPVTGGYAMLHMQERSGCRWTWLTDDLDYVRAILVVRGAVAVESVADTKLPEWKFPIKRPGWPDEWKMGNSFMRGPWS